MKTVKTDKRYLSEVFNELPKGVINKKLADVGGTYLAASCNFNYIIVCPTRDLVDSIEADKNNKYSVFKCYGGTKKDEFDKYCKSNTIKKIAVTYDSFIKLTNWIDIHTEYRVLIDEYHLLLQNVGFREEAINNLFNTINKYDYVSYITATPFDCKYEIKQLRELDHYEIEWERELKINTARIKSPSPVKAVTKIIREFLDYNLSAPNNEGEPTKVKELYIFMNSVTSIRQVCDTLDLQPEDVKICCANRIRNRKLIDKYDISSVTSPNRKLNFFTSKCFQGCNLFTNNGLIIVVSDANRESMVTDLTSDLVQIAGRLRDNNEYHNCFRNFLVHIYSTKSEVMSDEEFEEMMNEKVEQAHILISGNSKLNDEESKAMLNRLNLSNDVVTIENNRLVYSELKNNYFRYWQELRKSYKDGISICGAYDKRFVISNQQYIADFEFKMAKKMTVSYQQLIKDYYEDFNPEYELEYPEFKEYKKYLTLSNLSSLRFNKEKALKEIDKKKKIISKITKLECGKFYTNSEIKELIGAKATLVKDYFNCTETKVAGKKGYRLESRIFNFTM